MRLTLSTTVGMKFAKLEMYIIIAIFVAMFDYSLEDGAEKPLDSPPPIDRSLHGSTIPSTPMRLRYKLRMPASSSTV
jgi:hypothetical protein